VKGIHQIKAGATYTQTFLNEDDSVGIVDPTYNAPCITDIYPTTSVNPYPWVAVPDLLGGLPGLDRPVAGEHCFQPECTRQRTGTR